MVIEVRTISGSVGEGYMISSDGSRPVFFQHPEPYWAAPCACWQWWKKIH